MAECPFGPCARHRPFRRVARLLTRGCLSPGSGAAEGAAGSPPADSDGSSAGGDTPAADSGAASAELTAAELMAELTAISERPPPPARIGLSAGGATTYSVVDCRNLVKTLICGVKTITWGCASCKVSGEGGVVGRLGT